MREGYQQIMGPLRIKPAVGVLQYIPNIGRKPKVGFKLISWVYEASKTWGHADAQDCYQCYSGWGPATRSGTMPRGGTGGGPSWSSRSLLGLCLQPSINGNCVIWLTLPIEWTTWLGFRECQYNWSPYPGLSPYQYQGWSPLHPSTMSGYSPRLSAYQGASMKSHLNRKNTMLFTGDGNTTDTETYKPPLGLQTLKCLKEQDFRSVKGANPFCDLFLNQSNLLGDSQSSVSMGCWRRKTAQRYEGALAYDGRRESEQWTDPEAIWDHCSCRRDAQASPLWGYEVGHWTPLRLKQEKDIRDVQVHYHL